MNETSLPHSGPEPGRSPDSGSGRRLGGGDAFRFALLLGTLGIDQLTKWWARSAYSLPGGEPDYFKVTQVIGEWLQFRLVYNSGAAFGMRPQGVMPFLHPTLFYALFSTAAILVLFFYYRKLEAREAWAKSGVALILSGAFGNLIDRLLLHKVTDFIDAGIPGGPRWPTFNVADSCVCIGVGLILAAPLFSGRRSGVAGSEGGSPAVPGASTASQSGQESTPSP